MLLLVTALLGLAWNLEAFVSSGLRDFGVAPIPRFAQAVAFASLGFLPAVVVHSVLRAGLARLSSQKGIPMRALFRIVRRAGLLVFAGLVLATPAAGQTGLATVIGLVADSSGAAVPGVTVTATNQATNIAYTGITNGAGNYVITSVPIRDYVISAGLTGFKRRSVQGDALGCADSARRLQDGSRQHPGTGRRLRRRRRAASGQCGCRDQGGP
jgi:hypothetical protein